MPKNAIRLAVILISAAAVSATAGETAKIAILRTPDGGIQPQAVVDASGGVHLIYFRGEPKAGDVHYVHAAAGSEKFSEPLRVNSQEKTVIARGSVRGAQLALGRAGRVYVAWMGSDTAEPKAPGDANPMLFTRLNDEHAAFEPQRNLIQQHAGLDGGGSVAADHKGNVYVVWHGYGDGSHEEADRRVWIARSNDDGRTFGPEILASTDATGCCPCCGIKAFVDPAGALAVLYRTATEKFKRDMVLLTSDDYGGHFKAATLDHWKVGYCVMSTASFAAGPRGTLAAWETEEQIYFAPIAAGGALTNSVAGVSDPGLLEKTPASKRPATNIQRATSGATVKPIAAPGPAGKRKHPALAVNAAGQVLLAWTEQMGHGKGGALAWQLYDANLQPIANQQGRADSVPASSLLTTYPRPDGGFTIVY